MKSISSGRTRRHHKKHKRTKKNTKKKYVKFPKRLKKQRKTLSEQSLKVANDYFISLTGDEIKFQMFYF